MTENPPPPPGGYPPPPPDGGYPPPPSNSPPPPAGGYPPPPSSGSVPPPPPGGYPEPPQFGAYPPAPGFGPQPFSVGDGLTWAWQKFSKNALPLVVVTLIALVLVSVVSMIFQSLSMAVSPGSAEYDSYDTGFDFSATADLSSTGIVVMLIGYLVLLVVGAAVTSAYLVGIFDIANGRQVEISSFFRPQRIGAFAVLSLLVGIATGVTVLVCTFLLSMVSPVLGILGILPGLVVSILLLFSTLALLDRNLRPVDAMKFSFELVKNNFGTVLLVWLLTILLAIVGVLLCFVGLLVAAPVIMLLEVYTYRRLSGGEVAPALP
ncbi:hypothetical protein [[Mycobacterium] wendilense]|uniref:Integral membrane protein n=1 Tax=[Mycobacterium] wendilense TaxID=3064284 RepID=A0ABN9NVC5_9MYCO|nr:hypothetical protein [Mycolicibacterium sp. MU0050]CAJ1580416.1 hypothetical protein MU0050_001032 [Mycolicibacterium sp. MU0050]